MAGGIDWFRWHHGCVTDPKFQLVAKRAGVRLSDVIAVWAYLLEQASAAVERGDYGDIDAEAVDCLFGFDDGVTESIIGTMQARGLIEDGSIASWEKRQPKREREDSNSAERKRQQRAREADANNATPSHAKSRQEKPREEESREEPSSLRSEGSRAKRSAAPRPDDVTEQTWEDWQALRKAKKAPVTETVLSQARQEAEKAGMPLEDFLCIWCARGSQGLEASWLKPHELQSARASPAGETAYQRSMRERVQEVAPSIARQAPQDATDFFRTVDVPARVVDAVRIT